MRLVEDRTPRDLHPWRVVGRLLTCTRCGTLVDLVEPQGPDPHITPETYIGLCCMTPVTTAARSAA